MTASVDRLTQPATALLTIEDARRHCLAIDDEDGYLGDLIAAAQEEIEVSVRRALTRQTLRAVFEGFPSCSTDPLYLPRPPLVSLQSLSYTAVDGTPAEIDVEDIYVNTASTPGAVLPLTAWPSALAGRPVIALYTAGYETPPARAKHACRLLVAHWYLMREAVAVGGDPKPVPAGFMRLIAGLKWGDYS
jgi:uncharacterized phiE125 gp8 family phage protein